MSCTPKKKKKKDCKARNKSSMIRAIDQWGRMIEQLIWFRTLRASASNTMEEKPAFEAACNMRSRL